MTASLADLRILALDCQATGANPQKGHLLELGWMPVCASRPDALPGSGGQAFLSCLPGEEKIPRAVSRITGISDESMSGARTSDIIWQHLMESVGRINSENQMKVCPTVIHFARFEAPFLNTFTERTLPRSPFLSRLSAPMKLPSAFCRICRAGACEPSPAISITACPSSNAVPIMLLQRPLSGRKWLKS